MIVWRLAISLFLIGLILIPIQSSFAQDELLDGCDEHVQSTIAATTTLPYGDACKAYRVCDAEEWGFDPQCLFEAAVAMVADCEPNNRHCSDTALLYAGTIGMLQYAPDPTVPSLQEQFPILSALATRLMNTDETETPASPLPPQITVGTILPALEAFNRGDYATALDIYNSLYPRYFEPGAMLKFNLALTYQAIGETDKAFDAYADALDDQSDNPLIHYARALLYADMGKTTLASFEAEWLKEFTQNKPDWQAFIAPLVERYPLDTQQFSDWEFYPVVTYSYGSGGNVDEDNTLEASHPLQIAFDAEDQAIFIRNFTNGRACIGHCSDSVLLTYHEDEAAFRGSHQSYTRMHLDSSSGNFYGSGTWAYCIDSCATITFYLAPAGAADPRAALGGERCGVLSRLNLGMKGETAQPPGLTLFDKPAGSSFPGWENGYYWDVLVIGGGKCIDDQMWWEVITPEGKVGWMPENSSHSYDMEPTSRYYFINPLHASRQPADCRYATQRYCLSIGRIAIS